MARSRKMSDMEVRALVEAERNDSLSSFQSSKLQEERARALDYYHGDMSKDLPTLPDRSTAVSTDVSDTIEGLMPALMEIFASGDEVVRFEPVGIEDEEGAAQETDYVNHVFLHQNPGWMVLYTFIKDALLSKVGIVKVWWSEDVTDERETYYDLDDDAFAAVLEDDELELIAHSERPAPPQLAVPEQTPDMQMPGAVSGGGGGPAQLAPPPMVHDIIVGRKEEYECLKVEPVPPEDFGISRRAKSIRTANYCYQETPMSADDLVDLGYDKKQIENLSSGDEPDDAERLARDTVQESNNSSDSMDKATRPIRVVESYIRMDYDGTGVRLYRVMSHFNSGEILKKSGKADIVEIDRAPFAAMSPVPITHRFFGRSVADLVMDIQRIKTSLMRAMLDNIYLANNQRTEVSEEGATRNTIDDLLDNRPGGFVRTKKIGSIQSIQNTPIGDFVMPMVQYMDATREWRTGVTRQGQGIEADTLQNQTASAVGKVFTAAQARMRLIAQIFAETGIKDMFSLVHETIRKNDTKGNTVRLRNKWVAVDPRIWKHRKDMTISVGIGSGSRDQQIQFLFALLNLQKEGIAEPGLGLVEPQNIYNTLKRIVELGGLRAPDPYFTDPQGKPFEPQADPEDGKAEAEMQLQQMKMQMDQQKAQADLQLSREKAQAEMQLSKQKMEAEFALRREQMSAEMALRREQTMIEAGLSREGNHMKAANERDANLTNVKMGGKVG